MSQSPTNSNVLPNAFPETQAASEQEIPSRSKIRATNSLRYYMDLTWHLTQRDFILRYKGSVLGILWVIVIPLMQLMTLVFVFRSVVPLNIDSYPGFVFTALLPWTWFSNCLGTAGQLFTGNRDLIRKANFPPLILVLVNTLSNLLLYLIVLPLVFVTLLIYGHHLSWTLAFLPVLLLFEIILIAGFSMMIASWNVLYRDVQQVVGVLLTLLFWITPVFYKSHAVDQRYQFVFDANPVAALIKSYRDIMFYSNLPELRSFLFVVSASLIIGLLGYIVYRRKLHDVIDTL